jgi:hypothetical protein
MVNGMVVTFMDEEHVEVSVRNEADTRSLAELGRTLDLLVPPDTSVSSSSMSCLPWHMTAPMPVRQRWPMIWCTTRPVAVAAENSQDRGPAPTL